MKIIKIITYQPVAHFRKPTAFIIKESFPMPPYSTVIGAIHAMCGFKSYVDMDISIQGKSESNIFDFASNYIFKPNTSFSENRHQLEYLDGNKKCGVNVGPVKFEEIINLELVIHIYVKDENMYESVLNGLKNPKIYPSLGRAEDLLIVKEISEEKLIVGDKQVVKNKFNIYIPNQEQINEDGTVFRLNKKYILVKNRRKWEETINVLYINEGQVIEHNAFDLTGCPVYLA